MLSLRALGFLVLTTVQLTETPHSNCLKAEFRARAQCGVKGQRGPCAVPMAFWWRLRSLREAAGGSRGGGGGAGGGRGAGGRRRRRCLGGGRGHGCRRSKKKMKMKG